jgi:hypothetical protein
MIVNQILMIVNQINTKGWVQKPYITTKNKYIDKNNVQGCWELWIYSKDVIVNRERKFEYRKLRYSGFPARFKYRQDAIEYARNLLGL